ncbi:unnamed protein product [Vicia faba]|uniref:Transmembrane protein n=1 Tax=Vicia faba TaxID=3906 RepID=A0AAV0YRC1_VICFA|nr:unnamed protein product [Vicia faba]
MDLWWEMKGFCDGCNSWLGVTGGARRMDLVVESNSVPLLLFRLHFFFVSFTKISRIAFHAFLCNDINGFKGASNPFTVWLICTCCCLGMAKMMLLLYRVVGCCMVAYCSWRNGCFRRWVRVLRWLLVSRVFLVCGSVMGTEGWLAVSVSDPWKCGGGFEARLFVGGAAQRKEFSSDPTSTEGS